MLRVQVRPPYKRERASIRHAMMKLGLSVKRPFQTATRVVNYKGAVCISASATWQIAAFMQECHWNHCDKLAALKGTSKYHCNYYPVEYILTAFVIFAQFAQSQKNFEKSAPLKAAFTQQSEMGLACQS